MPFWRLFYKNQKLKNPQIGEHGPLCTGGAGSAKYIFFKVAKNKLREKLPSGASGDCVSSAFASPPATPATSLGLLGNSTLDIIAHCKLQANHQNKVEDTNI